MKSLLNKLSGLRPGAINLRGEEVPEDASEEYYEEDAAEEGEEEDTGDESPFEGGEGDDEETAEEEAEDEDAAEEKKWLSEEFEEEGQLSIDVYQTPETIVVKSTIAGVKPEDIDISINNDMLTVRGKREQKETVRDQDYLLKECYWGSFSRSVILPVEVEPDKIDATLENGVLTVILPKAKNAKQIKIKVKEK